MEYLVLIPWTASAVASPQNQIPSECQTRAKPAFAPSCLRRTVLRRGEGGAGGDRTLVQTTATWAFYMRSLFIGFRPAPGEGHPSVDLGPVSYLCFGPPHRPVFHDDTSKPGRRLTGLPERYSFAVLLFARIKPNSLGLLSCESVVCVACYSVEALGYGPHLTPDMLTRNTKAAVESRSAPLKERFAKIMPERPTAIKSVSDTVERSYLLRNGRKRMNVITVPMMPAVTAKTTLPIKYWIRCSCTRPRVSCCENSIVTASVPMNRAPTI